MSLSYFDKSVEVTLNSSGFGIAKLAPDTGQFWLPTFVHVGTSTFAGSCSVHIGGIGIYDYTTQVDETSAGGNDTTAACSGMIVSPGMSIAGQFFGGTANDTALVRVVGLSSDVPPTIGLEPGIPGHKFSGTSSTVFVANQPIGVNVNNTPTVTIGSQPINVDVANTPAVTISGTPTVDIGAQPIGVTENSKQMFVNQPLLAFDLTIAAGSVANLIPAVANRQLFLHHMRIEPATTSAGFSCHLEDTSGAALADILLSTNGTVSGAYRPAYGPLHFGGAPVTTGLGLQIHNEVGSSQEFVGYIAYSF